SSRRAIRLKGELYGESWTAQSTLEREAQAAARAGIGRAEYNRHSAPDFYILNCDVAHIKIGDLKNTMISSRR
ncbi:hypothetical protein, partial [Aeromonas veronii]